jgi:surfactin synthase thioesterase subunit
MTVTDSSPWLVFGAPRPGAPCLYCFPHGGGSATSYLSWSRLLPGVQVIGVQPPGHGDRIREAPWSRMTDLVDALVAEIDPVQPYAFFGHSLGGLVAYEVARRLRDDGRRTPDHLFVSANPAPDLPRLAPPILHLPDAELIAEVSRLHGGIPDEILSDPQLVRLAARPLRADYAIVETYRWRPGLPLPCPVSVLAGTDDTISESEMRAWQRHTERRLRMRWFPGGHFYLQQERRSVLRTLSRLLRDTFRGTQVEQNPARR